MILSFAIALVLMILALTVQGLWFDLLLRRFVAFAKKTLTLLPKSGRAVVMALYALAGLLPHFIAIVLWTLVYVYVIGAGEEDALFEPGFYFAATTHSTLGFGDITLNESWRVLSSLQALGGFLMFAWNAAFLFEIMGRLYKAAPRERA